jgi:hypothetical protein
MKENRSETRFDICLTARWQGSATNQNVRISDLSRGGCYVDTIGEVIVGETLFLEILMSDGEWFELQGVVARDSPGLGFGVRFMNLNEKQQHQLDALIKVHDLNSVESFDTSDYSENFIPLEQIDFNSRMAR